MTKTYGRNELDRAVVAIKYNHQNIPSGYLRISITDTCNMRCSYCHNEGQIGVKVMNMTVEQLRYIVTNARRYGLVKVRLTGGEPLLHPDCQTMLRMLKRELAIPTVGFNTNGILMSKLLPIASEKLIDDLVIGVDYVDGKISKDSTVGMSSDCILGNILQLKELGQDVSIACVYDGNYERLERMAAWCLDHKVVLKILQRTDESIKTEISDDFILMTRQIIDRFSLKVGIIATFSEYYGMTAGVPEIYFFHSHCRVRECVICGKIHIRVTADGFIKSCIQEDVQFPLLTGQFDESMLKVIANLGYPPESRRAEANMVCP
jgi:GTP 3',8-cyclase